MSDTPNPTPDPAANFAKLWSDSCSRLMQAAMAYSPETASPELLRQIRGGLFQALSQSWQEYMRSPQFLQGMKQLMDQAVAFRKFSAELMTKTRHATEGVAQEDLEDLRFIVGQMESRLARHLESLSAQISQLQKEFQQIRRTVTRPSPARPRPVRKPTPSARQATAKHNQAGAIAKSKT